MKRILYKSFLLLLALVCLLGFNGCGMNDPGEEIVDWEQLRLGHMLPVPEEKTGNVVENNSERLEVRMSDLMRHEFDEYTDACQEKGFNIDVKKSEGRYEKFVAYNQQGYKLQVYYWPGDLIWYPRYIICLEEPIEMSAISWPTVGLGSLLPKPNSLYGKIEVDYSKEFSAYIGHTSKADVRDYINKCKYAGFDNSQFSDQDFCAQDAQGNEIEVNYEGYNIMFVKVTKAPDPTPTPTQE